MHEENMKKSVGYRKKCRNTKSKTKLQKLPCFPVLKKGANKEK